MALFLLPVMLSLVTADLNPSVCSKKHAVAGQPSLPKLPPTFEAEVELQIIQKNTTVTIREFFDQASNQSALRITKGGTRTDVFMQYDSQKMVTVSGGDTKTCKVTNMTNSRQSMLFGSHASPSSVFHMDQASSYVYQGLDVVRGITVRKWTACLYWADMDATSNVTWYFNDKSSWGAASGLPQVPVRAWVQGSVGSTGGHARPFEHYYDVYFFDHYIGTSDPFEVPSLAYCRGYNVSITPPSMPQAFSFDVEYVTTSTKSVSAAQPSFICIYEDQGKRRKIDSVGLVQKVDLSNKLGQKVTKWHMVPFCTYISPLFSTSHSALSTWMCKEHPKESGQSREKSDRKDEGLDGIKIQIARRRLRNLERLTFGEASTLRPAQLGSPYREPTGAGIALESTQNHDKLTFDTKMGLSKRVATESTSQQLVSEVHDFHTGMAYITNLKLGTCKYMPIEGGGYDSLTVNNHFVKMMTSNQIVGDDTDNITYLGVKTTRNRAVDVFVAERHDYPTAAPVKTLWEWHFTQADEGQVPSGTLLKLDVKMTDLGQTIVENIFNMQFAEPDLSQYDISACYTNLPRRSFKFSVSGNYSDIIQLNPPLFKYGVSITLVLITSLSPLRITNMQIDYNKNVDVTFDLLGSPPISGDVNNTSTAAPLDSAATSLVNNFYDFMIYYPYQNTPYSVYAMPGTLEEMVTGPTVTTQSPRPTQPQIAIHRTPKATPTTFPLWFTASTVDSKTSIPSLPMAYEVHTKHVMAELNQSTETHEVFDQSSGLLSLLTTSNSTETLSIINTTSREVHTIDKTMKTCKVTKLPSGNLDSVIGYSTNSVGKGEITSLAGALLYGSNRTYSYQGREVVRGMNCLKWWTLNATLGFDAHSSMDVMWYFSDPNSWDTALNWPWTPVRAMVVGQDNRVTPSLYYENVYDFIHFKNFIEVEDPFRTPDFTMCTGRTPARAFPQIAQAFSFTEEILDFLNGGITFLNTWYDSSMRLIKYTYIPGPASINSYGYVPITQIDDFNTGVRYLVDNNRGNCTVSVIPDDSPDARNQSGHLTISSAAQILRLDTINYTYAGSETGRDLPSDRYVGERNDIPGFSPMVTILEWHFQKSSYTRVQERVEMYQDAVPLQVKLRVPAYGMSYTHNIFNFIQKEPDIGHWNVESCYLNRDRIRVQFLFSGKYSKQIFDDQGIFEQGLLLSLISSAAVSPLRIAEMKLQFEDNITVSFTMLDKAPVYGDVGSVTETSLLGAQAKLQRSFDNHTFSVLFIGQGDSIQEIKPVPNSLQFVYEGPGFTTPSSNSVQPSSKKVKTSTATVTKPSVTKPIPSTSSVTKPTSSKTTKSFTVIPPISKVTTGSIVTNPSAKISVVTNPVTSSKVTSNTLKSSRRIEGSTQANHQCDPGDTRYKSGVVAGVCVTMVVFGGAAGTILAIFLKRRSGSGWINFE